MTVAFHSHTMTYRGSENALWDYANFNESVLGNRSVICCHAGRIQRENPVYQKWSQKFPVIGYRSYQELGRSLRREGAKVLYQIKAGPFDGMLVPGIRNCIHAMFLSDEFHGDCFAYVSPWASRVMTGTHRSFVPHWVPRLTSTRSLRGELGIPGEAIVLGRHGGWDTFNIPFVRQEIRSHARHHPQDHFVFLNTEPISGTEKLGNVHYLPATVLPEEKASFLATCDAMLHARWHGETFGIAVGEFAILGKPVITYRNSRERAHLEMLGSEARVYHDRDSLRKILSKLKKQTAGRTEYHEYGEPHAVMKMFQYKFLDGGDKKVGTPRHG